MTLAHPWTVKSLQSRRIRVFDTSSRAQHHKEHSRSDRKFFYQEHHGGAAAALDALRPPDRWGAQGLHSRIRRADHLDKVADLPRTRARVRGGCSLGLDLGLWREVNRCEPARRGLYTYARLARQGAGG